MSDSWGHLEEEEREVIREASRSMSEAEIAERFVEYDDRVTFKIVRKTDRALAGDLDITFASDPGDSPFAGAGEEADTALFELAEEAREEQEVVEITLIPLDEFDYEPELSDDDRQAAVPIDEALADLASFYTAGAATATRASERATAAGRGDTESAGSREAGGEGDTFEAAVLPSVVDHRPDQSPIKDQGSRGTCVSFASIGLLEGYGHIPDDLSEQYAHYKFYEFEGRPQNTDQGLRTTNAAIHLARDDGRICLESEWPYIRSQSTINAMVADGTYGPPETAVKNQEFGIGAYKIITDQGLTGESIKNTRYLEALLYKGYNIVIGTYVSWDDTNNDGVLEPVLDSNGDPLRRGGHAMVLVGYNRAEQYFIVKNSWGAGWAHGGYGYLHYNLIRSCFKYGFVVDAVVPAAPSPLPAKLANAPFNTSGISRTDLRAAVLFLKTSQGRYAVTEAYAGYNLYLRNLRVYNPDGSVHLEKDSLFVRGSYLCDLDSGTETSTDADFWWRAVSSGVNYLVPRNGSSAVIGYNLAGLRRDNIADIALTSSPIPSANLDYAVVVGKTTTNRLYKMLVHAKADNTLNISYLEVFNGDGSRYKYATNIDVPSSWTYNIDTLRQGGGQYADIWWHVVSDDVGFLEKRSWAETAHVWNL